MSKSKTTRDAVPDPASAAGEVAANHVQIVGLLASEPTWAVRGDNEQLEFRVSVPRSPTGKDVIECFVLPGKTADRLAKVTVGRALSIQGELRSRYWSAAGKVASRLQLLVTALRVLPK